MTAPLSLAGGVHRICIARLIVTGVRPSGRLDESVEALEAAARRSSWSEVQVGWHPPMNGTMRPR
jgi:hypothetical protein